MTDTERQHLTSAELLQQLVDARINATTVEHAPLLTVEDAKAARTTDMIGGHCKNLFLRNKKGQMWLVTCHEDRQIDLKQLGELLTTATGNKNRLSFASAERLYNYLGVIPGAVSPFGLANDKNNDVSFYIDKALLDNEWLYFHPLDNRMTTRIGTQDMLRYLSQIDHSATVLDFDAPT